MEEIKAKFTINEPEPIKATFKIDVTPTKLSELENDMGYITSDEVELPDIDLSDYATKDELAKGLEAKQPKGDYADNSEVVHIANSETITGAKTLTQPLKVQNGAGTGSLLIGGDVNAGTVTNGARKLARVAVPTQTNTSLNAILLGFDSSGDDALKIKNRTYDAVSFGGQTKITNATSPMSIGFCVAKTRNGTSASDKIYPLELDSTEARFNVQPNYNGVKLATVNEIPKIQLTTQSAYDNLAIKEANTLYLIEE